jgi:hypothetical protein
MITKRERLEKRLKHLRNRVVGRSGDAVPVLLFGEQRSGTNMLLDCFRRSPRTAVYNETDDDAFVNYELRDIRVIQSIVEHAAASHVVLKPTADGNRAHEILEALPGARGVWIYRQYRDAVTSALALFRETSLEYLANVASRSPEARWRARNLADADIEAIGGHLRRGITESSARALIWYVRNSFFFRLGLNERTDIVLVNYEDLVKNPVVEVARVFDFVGLRFEKKYVDGIFASSIGRRAAPEIDGEIAALCDSLFEELAAHRREHALDTVAM